MNVRPGDVRIVAELDGIGAVIRYRIDVLSARCQWQALSAACDLGSARLAARRARCAVNDLTLGYFLETGECNAIGERGEISEPIAAPLV